MANLPSGAIITPQRSRGYQVGTAALTITASTTGSVTITFPTPFAALPVFVPSIVSGAGGLIRATLFTTSLTVSQAVVRVDLNASTTASCAIHWAAFEQ